MWNSNLHYNLLQQGARKYEDGEESQVSSQGTKYSQEETENLEPWSRIFDETEKRHETQLNAFINEYEVEQRFRECGPRENRERSSSCLQKTAKKSTLRESTMKWKSAMKKVPTFKKVMETQKEVKDSEEFDRLESTELAIDKRKSLLNQLYKKQPIPQGQD